MADISSVLGNLLKDVGGPLIGVVVKNALPGTLGDIGSGVAGKVIGELANALGAEPTPEAVTAAIEADPEKAKPIVAQVESSNRDAAVRELEARLKDTQDARAMQIQLIDRGSVAQYGAPVVSIMIVAGFLGLLGVFVLKPIPLNDTQADILKIMIGILAGGFAQVGNYWLGSSAGAARSSDTIRSIATSATSPSPSQMAGKVIDAAARTVAKK